MYLEGISMSAKKLSLFQLYSIPACRTSVCLFVLFCFWPAPWFSLGKPPPTLFVQNTSPFRSKTITHIGPVSVTGVVQGWMYGSVWANESHLWDFCWLISWWCPRSPLALMSTSVSLEYSRSHFHHLQQSSLGSTLGLHFILQSDSMCLPYFKDFFYFYFYLFNHCWLTESITFCFSGLF